MAYFSLNDSRPRTVRIRKDLIRAEAVRDFEFQTKRHFYDLPEKLLKPVNRTQKAAFDGTSLIGRYRFLPVTGIVRFDAQNGGSAQNDGLTASLPNNCEDEKELALVILDDRYYLSGEYRYAKINGQALFMIVTLENYKEIFDSMTKMSDRYYFDMWGRVLIEQGIAYFRQQLRRALKREGYNMTRFIYPGMSSFDLKNQKEIFNILKPEDIGVTLSSSYIMSPDKSFTCFTFTSHHNLEDTEPVA